LKVLRSWSECYEGPFELQEKADNISEEEQTMCVPTAELYVDPPNGVDIERAISKLIYQKATGRDQIPAELIKKEQKSSRRSQMNSF